jgi:hypothetical protein
MKAAFKKTAPYFVLVLLSLIIASPVFRDLNTYNPGDWGLHCFLDEAPRKIILEHGQFPFWNPYASGGRPALANPQFKAFRPGYLLTLAFGCNTGQRIELVLMFIVGALGMFVLMRHIGAKSVPAVFAATLFALSGYFGMHMMDWHVPFFPLFFVPWIYLCYLRSEDVRYFVAGAILFALTLFGGGVVYAYLPFGLFLGVHALVEAVQARTWRPVIRVAGMLALALLLAGVHTVPMLDYLSAHSRTTDTEREGITPYGFVHVFLSGDPRGLASFDPPVWIVHFKGQKWPWFEYGAYLGLLPFLFFFAGLFTFRKKQLPLIVAGIVGLLVAMGTYLPFGGLWPLLHKLPFISGIRGVARFMILFVFTLAIIAGLQADRSMMIARRKLVRWVLVFLMVFIIVDVAIVSHRAMNLSFRQPMPEFSPVPEFRNVVDQKLVLTWATTFYRMYVNLRENKGTINAFDPVPHTPYAVGFGEQGYRGEVYIDGKGTAEYTYWSPNKLVVRVNASEPSRVVINQNFDKGWRAKGSKVPESFNGLLSAQVSPGDNLVTFYYLPTAFIIGSLVSALTIAGTVIAWKKCGQRRKRRR